MTAAMRGRAAFELEESERLAAYAVRSAETRGRIYAEADHAYRTAFQRDRDRIVHSRAFRRLEYKTQVFVYREGDHYRNRLTHTLEGSQISRTIARALRLNEDLAEAVALAHDLGHTPFGHAGERVLNERMAGDGGFDHNRQTLRIVDLLEDRYPTFRGLNLTSETREGILKHGCDWDHPVPVPPPVKQPSLEAQVSDAADEIAYTNHDLDDGLRSELLTPETLENVALWKETNGRVRSLLGDVPEPVLLAQTVRALIDQLVTDLVEVSAARLAASGVGSVEAVRSAGDRLVGFSDTLEQAKRELKGFLHDNLYHHPRVLEMSDRGACILGDLFEMLRADPSLLPEHVRARFGEDGEVRAIADYVAGMTDRFAMIEHDRIRGRGVAR
ncbi:MAG: deoxyguanosinetriphosphate triphosphohydrolase [Myxococcota bacterium]